MEAWCNVSNSRSTALGVPPDGEQLLDASEDLTTELVDSPADNMAGEWHKTQSKGKDSKCSETGDGCVVLASCDVQIPHDTVDVFLNMAAQNM